jgi:TfoX/Sxy family transcriptional regulator of competence genes
MEMHIMQAELEERLHNILDGKKAESKRMFGGLCFMINGNMVIGTFRDGLLVRIGKDAHAKALAAPGAKTFTMNGKSMEGYVEVAVARLASDAALKGWVDLALAFNKTLPPKAAKPAKKSK